MAELQTLHGGPSIIQGPGLPLGVGTLVVLQPLCSWLCDLGLIDSVAPAPSSILSQEIGWEECL